MSLSVSGEPSKCNELCIISLWISRSTRWIFEKQIRLPSGRTGQRPFCQVRSKVSINTAGWALRGQYKLQRHAHSASCSDQFDNENFQAKYYKHLQKSIQDTICLPGFDFRHLLFPHPWPAFIQALGCNVSHRGTATGEKGQAGPRGNCTLVALQSQAPFWLIKQHEGVKEPREEEICKWLGN